MRKASYLFLALGLLSPFVTSWFIQREIAIHRAQFGMDPEGMGLFGIMALGAQAAFILFLISAICAMRAYQVLTTPRRPLRKVEVAILCMPPPLVIFFVYVFMVNGLPI
jgi:hypothetical protein